MLCMTTAETYRIPSTNIDELQSKIAKLNKRAAKLGVEPISITLGDTESEVVNSERGVETVIEYVNVTIEGTTPKLNGWQFVATLEHDEGSVIIRKLPSFDGEVDLTEYRAADPTNCDHCHTRRRRNDTYVVMHDDGSLKQVGSTCLADFIGGQNPQQIAKWLEQVADMLDNASNGGGEARTETRIDTEAYLVHTAAMIRLHGWVSKGRAWETQETPTAEQASNNLFAAATNLRDRQGLPLWDEPTTADAELAVNSLNWVRALTEEDLSNDYLYNLFAVCQKDSIRYRQFGIAASLIQAYQRAEQDRIKREQRTADKADSFLGEVKEKIGFTGTVLRVNWRESIYAESGSAPVYTFRTEDGHEATWFSSKDLELEQGDKVNVTGTIKSLDDHPRFGKSTIITRCKVEVI